jgi:hypothetical protein
MPAAAIACPDPSYVLKVALVFQDEGTRLRARQVCHRLAKVVGERAIQCTEWRINDLQDRRVFCEGVTALAEADAIAIAVRDTERLPGVFYLWVNLWLQRRYGTPGALIALVGPLAKSNPAANELRSYLHAIADQGHLDFLLKECPRPDEPTRGVPEDLLEWAEAA